jgi:ribosomal protein S18 acetylase RimI-like enzyme
MARDQVEAREFIVDPMRKEDIDIVTRLAERVTEFDTGTNSLKFFKRQTLEEMIQSDECITLVARSDIGVIGFVITSINSATKDAYIHTIYIVEQERKKGVGTLLMQETLLALQKRPEDCNHIFGLVEAENHKGMKLVEKVGFEPGKKFQYVDMMLTKGKD